MIREASLEKKDEALRMKEGDFKKGSRMEDYLNRMRVTDWVLKRSCKLYGGSWIKVEGLLIRIRVFLLDVIKRII